MEIPDIVSRVSLVDMEGNRNRILQPGPIMRVLASPGFTAVFLA
jgi:hypothetical protein